MSDAFVGEIRIFPFNFPPRGWAWCDGQLLSIAQHPVLFAVLGTTFGGDGKDSFALPDLRGRAPVHRAPRLRTGGERSADASGAEAPAPVPHANPSGSFQPYLVCCFCIALDGAYPARG